MKNILFFFILFFSVTAKAEIKPNTLIKQLNNKFQLLNDYSADVFMKFDIPGVKMNNMNGKVYFKKPNKFRIKTKGIFFLPKHNPMQSVSAMFLDTNAYTAVISGYEKVDDKECAIVNLIPTDSETEMILGKFWIDINNPLILKSQITTKKSGTIETQNYYSEMSKFALPSKTIINVEINKMKIPKMMTLDLKKKSKQNQKDSTKEKGTIELNFSNYKINTKMSDAVFTELEK